MKTRQQKEQELAELRKDLESHDTAFICTFGGIKVDEDFQLRRQVKASGGKYRVVKNRLVKRAAENTPFDGALKEVRGMTSLAFADEDPVSLVKALVAYGKEHPAFKFKAGVVEGRVLDVDALNELATLPGKEELYAKLLFLINAPGQRLATVINAVGRDLAIVIDQGVKEKKFSE